MESENLFSKYKIKSRFGYVPHRWARKIVEFRHMIFIAARIDDHGIVLRHC